MLLDAVYADCLSAKTAGKPVYPSGFSRVYGFSALSADVTVNERNTLFRARHEVMLPLTIGARTEVEELPVGLPLHASSLHHDVSRPWRFAE